MWLILFDLQAFVPNFAALPSRLITLLAEILVIVTKRLSPWYNDCWYDNTELEKKGSFVLFHFLLLLCFSWGFFDACGKVFNLKSASQLLHHRKITDQWRLWHWGTKKGNELGFPKEVKSGNIIFVCDKLSEEGLLWGTLINQDTLVKCISIQSQSLSLLISKKHRH